MTVNDNNSMTQLDNNTNNAREGGIIGRGGRERGRGRGRGRGGGEGGGGGGGDDTIKESDNL